MRQQRFSSAGHWFSVLVGSSIFGVGAIGLPPALTASPPNPLQGTWTLVEWSDGAAHVQRPISSTPVTLVFAGIQVRGATGCNHYTGSYQVLREQVLSISPLASTKRACPPSLMRQESQYLSALQMARVYTLTPSGQLRIAFQAANGTGILVFQPQPIRALW